MTRRRCSHPSCHAPALALQVPFSERIVFVCHRHVGARLVAALRSVIA